MRRQTDPPKGARRPGEGERRVEPVHREIVVNEADRVLVRLTIEETLKHLGIKNPEQHREDQTLYTEVKPLLAAMLDSYRWRRDLYKWWLTATGKAVLQGLTFLMLLTVLYGFFPAVRQLVDKVAP